MEESPPCTSIQSTTEDPGVAMMRNDEAASQAMPLLLPEEGEKEEGPQFARAKLLSQYIPELDPSNPRAITLRVKMARRMTMLKLQLAISSLVVEATDNWAIDNPLPQRPWWKFPPLEKWGVVSYDLAPIYTLKASAENLTRLEPKECINEYLNPLESTRAVLVVAQNMTTIHNNGSSLLDGWMTGWDDWDGSNYWLCSAYDTGYYSKICTPQWADTLDYWIVGIGGKPEGLPNVVVNYCLVSDGANNEGRCGFHYSAHIMVTVCICTFLECLFILWTSLYFRKYDPTEEVGRRRQSLVTVGDAIADFLHEPIAQDSTGPKIAKGTAYQLHITQWEEHRSYWFTAVSTPTWVVSFILFAIGLAVPSGLTGAYISRLKTLGMDLSLPEVWRLGFKANPAMIGHSFWQSRNKGYADLIVNVLIANSPQVVMSFLYLFSNAILARQLVADEWGIFLVQTSSFGPGPAGQRHSEFNVSARGYSALGIILAITLWAVFVLALMIHSFAREFRGIPRGFHLMGMSSAGIGLMCKRPEDDSDAYLFPAASFLPKDSYLGLGDEREKLLPQVNVPDFVSNRTCTELNGNFGSRTSSNDNEELKVVCPEIAHESGPEYVQDGEKYTWYEMGVFTRWDYTDQYRVLSIDTLEHWVSELQIALAKQPTLEFMDPFVMNRHLIDQVIMLYDISVWPIRDPVRQIERVSISRKNAGERFDKMHEMAWHGIHVSEVLKHRFRR
ncbi:hypothetical protein DL768_005652 [Monosporascus sp. mg162]|nr:hypothetical protein DL768_005652 [Monosporascus sp. mg162]